MLKVPIPFEIHLTTGSLNACRQNDFVEFCSAHDSKPLLIELSQGTFVKQPMLSKIVFSQSLGEVLALATDLSTSLKVEGFSIARLKIEVPAHKSFFFESETPGFNRYFEWHGKIAFERVKNLERLCQQHKVHMSLNALRNNNTTRFITLREFGTFSQFTTRIDALIVDLQQGNWELFKQQSEYCIYDNNTFLDAGWLPQ